MQTSEGFLMNSTVLSCHADNVLTSFLQWLAVVPPWLLLFRIGHRRKVPFPRIPFHAPDPLRLGRKEVEPEISFFSCASPCPRFPLFLPQS
jgi:hypothetical protein